MIDSRRRIRRSMTDNRIRVRVNSRRKRECRRRMRYNSRMTKCIISFFVITSLFKVDIFLFIKIVHSPNCTMSLVTYGSYILY